LGFQQTGGGHSWQVGHVPRGARSLSLVTLMVSVQLLPSGIMWQLISSWHQSPPPEM